MDAAMLAICVIFLCVYLKMHLYTNLGTRFVKPVKVRNCKLQTLV